MFTFMSGIGTYFTGKRAIALVSGDATIGTRVGMVLVTIGTCGRAAFGIVVALAYPIGTLFIGDCAVGS